MCGGFTFFDGADFTSRFRVSLAKKPTSYNIRPTMETPVVYTLNGDRSVADMKFGMIPVWAKDEKIGYKLFNARSETLFEKPAWKRSAKSKRCVIPSNGFYEWKKQQDGKHPFLIKPKDQDLFSFAGVYDHWTNQTDKTELMSFAIVTTTPNKEMRSIHDRMPVILTPAAEDDWLGEESDPGFLSSLFNPYPDGLIEMYEVSQLVNSARNQGKELIKPLA